MKIDQVKMHIPGKSPTIMGTNELFERTKTRFTAIKEYIFRGDTHPISRVGRSVALVFATLGAFTVVPVLAATRFTVTEKTKLGTACEKAAAAFSRVVLPLHVPKPAEACIPVVSVPYTEAREFGEALDDLLKEVKAQFTSDIKPKYLLNIIHAVQKRAESLMDPRYPNYQKQLHNQLVGPLNDLLFNHLADKLVNFDLDTYIGLDALWEAYEDASLPRVLLSEALANHPKLQNSEDAKETLEELFAAKEEQFNKDLGARQLKAEFYAKALRADRERAAQAVEGVDGETTEISRKIEKYENIRDLDSDTFIESIVELMSVIEPVDQGEEDGEL